MARSILIADEDVYLNNMALGVPWESTASAFNMRTPKETLNVKQYQTAEEWQEALGDLDTIEAVWLVCDLEEKDYDFLSKLPNIRQLYIYTGEKLSNMNFVKDMVYLKHLFINHSNISDVTPLAELLKNQEQKRASAETEKWVDRWNLQLENVAITDGKIADLSPFAGVSTYISEFNFSGNFIKDLSPLRDVRTYYFSMEGNQIEDIKERMDTHACYFMNFRHNKIKDVTFMLEHEYPVGKFYIAGNPCEYRALRICDFRDSDVYIEEKD